MCFYHIKHQLNYNGETEHTMRNYLYVISLNDLIFLCKKKTLLTSSFIPLSVLYLIDFFVCVEKNNFTKLLKCFSKIYCQSTLILIIFFLNTFDEKLNVFSAFFFKIC